MISRLVDSALRPYSPGGKLNGFPATLRSRTAIGSSSLHRLQLGLPGYLIRFAPPAFIPHRRTRSGRPPSPLVVLRGSEDFTPTPRIPSASPAPWLCSISSSPSVEQVALSGDLQSRLRMLY